MISKATRIKFSICYSILKWVDAVSKAVNNKLTRLDDVFVSANLAKVGRQYWCALSDYWS